MKKIILIIAIIAIGLTSALVVTNSKPTPVNEFLIEAGFTNLPDIKHLAVDAFDTKVYWKKKGFNFLSFSDLDTLMKLNGFMISKPQNYIGNMPDSIKKVFQINYNKLKEYELSYELFDGTTSKLAYLSKNDLGYWINKNEKTYDNEFLFLSEKIKDRLTNKDIFSQNNINPNSDFWMITYEPNNNNAGIYVVAHQSKFLKESILIENQLNIPSYNPDPLIVMKQRNGWIVLAHWE